MCRRWGSKSGYTLAERALVWALYVYSKRDIGLCLPSVRLTYVVRPVLSLVSMTSLCLEFCLEDAHSPSCGLMSCICSSPYSSHVCCRCCFMCCCSMALQSSTGKLLLTGSGSSRASFASSSAFSFPGIQRKEMFWSAWISF